MCFSASASFGAGIVISTIGVVSLTKVQSPLHYFFALIPLIFAVQQISEGFLWLALSDPAYLPLEGISTYTFLFFAQVVWPFWIPFSILMIEKEFKNKNILKILLAMGTVVSIYLAYCLINYNIQAKIIGHHISYIQDYPTLFNKYSGVLYVLSTVLPPYFSSINKVWILSVAIFVSYLITNILYTDYIVSVWCFFASIISVIVLVMLQEMKVTKKSEPLLNNS
jgi:hypothetical protein